MISSSRFRARLLPRIQTPSGHVSPRVVAIDFVCPFQDSTIQQGKTARRTVYMATLRVVSSSTSPRSCSSAKSSLVVSAELALKTLRGSVPPSNPTIARCSFPKPLLISVWYTPHTYFTSRSW